MPRSTSAIVGFARVDRESIGVESTAKCSHKEPKTRELLGLKVRFASDSSFYRASEPMLVIGKCAILAIPKLPLVNGRNGSTLPVPGNLR
jgi:hypothetical protein